MSLTDDSGSFLSTFRCLITTDSPLLTVASNVYSFHTLLVLLKNIFVYSWHTHLHSTDIFKQTENYASRKRSTSSPQNKQEQSMNAEPNVEFNLSYETIKDGEKQSGWRRVNRRERHTVNLISILQQDCLGFVVCCGPLACLSHFNECIFPPQITLVALPSRSLSNVSLRIKVFDQTTIVSKCCSDCRFFFPLSHSLSLSPPLLLGEGVLGVSGTVRCD